MRLGLIQGITPYRKMMDELLNSRPGGQSRGDVFNSSSDPKDRGVNFTMFLTMMSERLFEFDVEAELLEAFESFDENDTGVVKVEEMKKWLSEVGERMDGYEVYNSKLGSLLEWKLTS
jgi:myosin regulatory light chain 12